MKTIRVSDQTHKRLKDVQYEESKGRNSDEPVVTMNEAVEALLWLYDEGKR